MSGVDNMTEWIHFKRLKDNDLSLPKYANPFAAAMDFAACLTRPCKKIIYTNTSNHKQCFIAGTRGKRYYPLSDGSIFPTQNAQLTIASNETIMVSLGFQCEFNKRHVLQLHVRSSLGLNGIILGNSTAIIDPDYRGELFVVLYNRTNASITINHGQRIVQGILLRTAKAVISEANELKQTERASGGFGSTENM